jgi:hypothetical protein
MKVLVTGGRHYADAEVVTAELDAVNAESAISLIITGGARGADALAIEWAQFEGIPFVVYEPDWNRWGKVAGPKRNKEMLLLSEPDLVVAFPGGRGTADCVKQARGFGIEVLEVG